jgi:hypothetical protein
LVVNRQGDDVPRASFGERTVLSGAQQFAECGIDIEQPMVAEKFRGAQTDAGGIET